MLKIRRRVDYAENKFYRICRFLLSAVLCTFLLLFEFLQIVKIILKCELVGARIESGT
jgi:hypothetical protein